MPHRVYKNNPIVEAIIAISVTAPPDISAVDFGGAMQGIREDFPERQILGETPYRRAPHRSFFFPGSAFSSDPPSGLRYISADKARVLEVKTDKFVFSRLRPYPHWEVFQDEARKLWQVYLDAVKPERVNGIAVRYLNRIDIPRSEFEMSEYFNTYPQEPLTLPFHDITRFRFQLTMPQPDIEAEAVINQVSLTPSLEDLMPGRTLHFPVRLDVELMKGEIDYEPQSEDVWDALEVLRERKNAIFEACITDATRELIQ